MNKVLLMALSGALTALTSSDIYAINQTEMVEAISLDTGLSKTQSFNALNAFEKQLKEEMNSKRSVTLDNFGTYRPREISGKRTGRSFAGSVTYDNWKLVKKPELVDEATFNARAAARAGMNVVDYDKATESYKKEIGTNLRRGGSVVMHGEGTYSVGRIAAKTYYNKDGSINNTRLESRKVNYKGYGDGNKQKFIPHQVLSDKLR